MSSVKQKILQFIDNKGITKHKFHKETGITRGVIDNAGGISEENIHKLIKRYPEISPNWLFDYNINDTKSQYISQYEKNESQDILKESVSYIERPCKECAHHKSVIDSMKKTIDTQDKLIEALERELKSK